MKRLTDLQLSEAEERAKVSAIPLSQCPTCKAVMVDGEIESGTYRLEGREYPCNCREQIKLRTAYLYANVPGAYFTLDWDRDFQGEEAIKEGICSYLSGWDYFQANGVGLELSGSKQGTGKTFAAVHIAKTLIKNYQFEVYYQSFADFLIEDFALTRRVLETPVLILDEVKKPYSDKQKGYFADRFEDLIRHRNHNNGVTIFTTNLLEREINELYPRAFSLLREKELRINFKGTDFRSNMGEILLNRSLNKEKAPIV